jgi:hypothetical protein
MLIVLRHAARRPRSWLISDVGQKQIKTYLTILLFCAVSLRAEIEFSGFFTTSKEAFFSLSDTETQRSSGWLQIGQSFGSYTLLSFDREEDIITVKQTRKYGTGSNCSVCRAVHSAVRRPPQRGQAR